jgi:hypothetical protein
LFSIDWATYSASASSIVVLGVIPSVGVRCSIAAVELLHDGFVGMADWQRDER